MNILVVTHKKTDYPKMKAYNIFQVGAESNGKIPGYQYDNVGSNISNKNKIYCELTAYYWLWKNSKDNIVGIVHYRRFFQSKDRRYDFKLRSILTSDEINSHLNNYDIILPKKRKLKNSIKTEYAKYHEGNDWDKLDHIIKKYYSNYYDAFTQISNYDYSYDFNMLITRKSIFDDYCEWLFSVLSKFERDMDIINYDDYQKRVVGFLAERLLNVWIVYKKLKVKEIKVIHTDDSYFDGFIKDEIKRLIGKYN